MQEARYYTTDIMRYMKPGAVFGDLVALRLDHDGKSGHSFWQFSCTCGKVFVADSHTTVKRGHCGCRTVRRWDIRPPESERFLKWVIKKENGCWEWRGHRKAFGYGVYLREKAHRASYRIFKGPIPDGLWVLHKCDNPPCVNPDHLYLGTAQNNSDDCWNRGRAIREKGEDRYCAKLNDGKVAEILLHLKNGRTVISLSKEFGVSRAAIYHIAYGDRWKHVPRPEGLKYEKARLGL